MFGKGVMQIATSMAPQGDKLGCYKPSAEDSSVLTTAHRICYRLLTDIARRQGTNILKVSSVTLTCFDMADAEDCDGLVVRRGHIKFKRDIPAQAVIKVRRAARALRRGEQLVDLPFGLGKWVALAPNGAEDEEEEEGKDNPCTLR